MGKTDRESEREADRSYCNVRKEFIGKVTRVEIIRRKRKGVVLVYRSRS